MKAIGATNARSRRFFWRSNLMLALVGGAIGFVFGAGLARVLGSERLWHAGSAAHRSSAGRSWDRGAGGGRRQPDSPAAGGAFRSRADSAGRVMFGRASLEITAGKSRAPDGGARRGDQRRRGDFRAAESGVRHANAKLTQEFRLLGANLVISRWRAHTRTSGAALIATQRPHRQR